MSSTLFEQKMGPFDAARARQLYREVRERPIARDLSGVLERVHEAACGGSFQYFYPHAWLFLMKDSDAEAKRSLLFEALRSRNFTVVDNVAGRLPGTGAEAVGISISFF